MAFQPCPGVATVVVEVTGAEGDVSANVLHFSNGGASAWTGANLITLVNAIDNWAATGGGGHSFKGFLPTSAAITQYLARDLTTASGPEYNPSVNEAGGDSGALLNAGLTKALTLRTGLAGRSQRGRVFQPFPTANNVSGTDVNYWDATHLNNLVTAWNSLIAAITAANAAWYWGVLSRYNNKVQRTNGIITAITSVGFSHTAFDFQRRRAPFHSRHH